ncbi:MAG: NADH-quinone oxidoreductase subunit C [Oscillochloris sp.]|nr:NADH-quinone oxidoreductase subunit C [Oscillochloris sp.]
MPFEDLLSAVGARFPKAILGTETFRGDLSVRVRREDLATVVAFLRDNADQPFDFLENLCGVDYLNRDPRFEVVIHLISTIRIERICLKVGVPEHDPHIPSLTPLYPTANYQERETYDLYGIIFDGHPNLSRILLPDDWVGYPLRKDHPLGDEEVAFNFNQDRIYAQKPFAKE